MEFNHSITQRYNSLSKQNQQKIINLLHQEIFKIENIENQHQLELICQQNGHIYKEKNSGWQDCSYRVSNSEYSSITTRKRLVNSLYYYKIGKEKNIFIKWVRICRRCGAIERIDTIPNIILEQHQIAKKKEKKKNK